MVKKTGEQVRRAILDSIEELLAEQGMDMGEVAPDTLLGGDLGLASVDAIHLLIGLEDRLDQPLSFDELTTDESGEYRIDLTFGELLAFVCGKVGTPVPTGGQGP